MTQSEPKPLIKLAAEKAFGVLDVPVLMKLLQDEHHCHDQHAGLLSVLLALISKVLDGDEDRAMSIARRRRAHEVDT